MPPHEAPDRLTRFVQVTMVVNGILHLVGVAGMVVSRPGDGIARRLLASAIAALAMFLLVARRLRSDPRLVALPLAFVLCNFVTTVIDWASTRRADALRPAIAEGLFLVVYTAFALHPRANPNPH